MPMPAGAPLLMSITCDRPAMVCGRFYRFYRLFVDVFSSWTFLPWTFLPFVDIFSVDNFSVDVITEHPVCQLTHDKMQANKIEGEYALHMVRK